MTRFALGARLVAGAAFAILEATVAAAEPKPSAISYYYDAFEQSLTRPVSRAFDPALLVRKIGGNRREAENVDEKERVRLPSTWWQPRLGFRAVSVARDAPRAGPGHRSGPRPVEGGAREDRGRLAGLPDQGRRGRALRDQVRSRRGTPSSPRAPTSW